MRKNKNDYTAFSLIELSIVIGIIGLIITGIIAGQKIISLSRLVSARALTAFSPVHDIDGMTLWLESTSKDSFIDSERIDNKLISQWNDINPHSMNKNDVSQSIPSNQPTYVADAVNGLPAVRFNVVDGRSRDYLSKSNVYGYDLASAREVTLFIVQNHVPEFLTSYDYPVKWEYSSTNRISLKLSNTSITWSFPDTSNESKYTIASRTVGNKIICAARHSNGDSYIRIDGYNKVKTESQSPPEFTSNNSTLYVGSGDSGYNNINGYIAEIIIYNRILSTIEVEQIEEYLSKKWQITLIN